MMWIPQERESCSAVLSLGCEEAAILLQAGEMFRAVLDGCCDWAEHSQFLTPPATGEGMLVVVPRHAMAAWLGKTASHPVEREFQELLIQHARTTELPPL
jgi:hypothetical protein